MNENQKKHRKELQAKITALKKSIPKGDRKKKEFVDQLAKLQAELENIDEDGNENSRDCSEEVKELNEGMESLCNGDKSTKTEGRVSKAQKRRDKKAAKYSEREQRIIEQEQENISGSRHIEQQKIKSILKGKSLAIYEVPSNGDCLYAAVAHQLHLLGREISTLNLRNQIATYMRNHSHMFLPFLCDQETGDLMDEEKYAKYCDDTEKPSTWGGQPELQALTHVLQLAIEVIQAEGPPLIIGDEYKNGPKVVLIYHRHMYGLGEHYNSVITEEEIPTEDDFIQS